LISIYCRHKFIYSTANQSTDTTVSGIYDDIDRVTQTYRYWQLHRNTDAVLCIPTVINTMVLWQNTAWYRGTNVLEKPAALIFKGEGSFTKLVPIYQYTYCHIPADCNLKWNTDVTLQRSTFFYHKCFNCTILKKKKKPIIFLKMAHQLIHNTKYNYAQAQPLFLFDIFWCGVHLMI
jgi:hypothetical protein